MLFLEFASRYSLGDRIFLFRKIPMSVENHFLDRIAPQLEHSRHTWYLQQELITHVLFSPMIQIEENESVRQSFPKFENAEFTKRIGLPCGKPDFKLNTPQNTQIFELKRPAFTIFFHILNLSHSFLLTPVSCWTSEKCSQIIKLNKVLLTLRLLLNCRARYKALPQLHWCHNRRNNFLKNSSGR